jgi:cytoskeletal protein RodZ
MNVITLTLVLIRRIKSPLTFFLRHSLVLFVVLFLSQLSTAMEIYSHNPFIASKPLDYRQRSVHTMQSCRKRESCSLIGSRFATALLALTCSSSSGSTAFTPRAFLHTSVHVSHNVSPLQQKQQQQQQQQSARSFSSTTLQQIRGGSLSTSDNTSSSSSSTSLRMSSTAQAPTATGHAATAGAKLDALRQRMKELQLDVYLVPTDDPHLSGTRVLV